MLSNSRVSAGEYSYDATQPHAVSGVAAREGMVSASRCDVTWGVRNRATAITQDNWRLDIAYGSGLRREKSVLSLGNFWVRTTYYAGDDCEVEVTPSGTRHIDIIRADGRVVALHVRKGSLDSLYFVHTDLLGSWERVVDGGKNVVQTSHFDPWGNRMSATDWTASQNGVPLPFHHGFTGHEHYDRFGIINMNARLYDPVIARFFSPDPQVQNPFSTQGLNRYSYCGNNPVMYVDEDGESALLIAAVVGAVIGVYTGGVLSNNSYNPVKWDYSSGKTWGYMAAGAIVGGFSGWIGASIATSGIPFANTISMVYSSFFNSVGTGMYTGGQTPVSISLGFGSYDITNGTFRTISKSNGKYDNIGYILGIMANVSDLLMGIHPQKIDLITEHSDVIGHSSLVEYGYQVYYEWKGKGYAEVFNRKKTLISFGPDSNKKTWWLLTKGDSKWPTHAGSLDVYWRQTLNVNMSLIKRYSSFLNNHSIPYSIFFSSCVSHTSIALNLSGIFNIGLHPYLLAAQMTLWNAGIRPWFFSTYLNIN